MQLPKSEFSFRPELEEGEIISEESSLDAPKKRGRRSILKNSPSNRGGIKRKRAGTHRKRREHVSKSVDVSFHHDGAHLITGVDVRPISNCYVGFVNLVLTRTSKSTFYTGVCWC
ncbi:hypothetical protein KIN20_025175 [Parelaphostrongylus tenuis]|uniref:Uncharacterized protein n=1 Tax=Parelaphostrongylus tenuis TaxID=148309 RepID=A0AAD5QWH4_PARTN|nr:hypothetical protein KIN20_025175 [Parelaphostrongylus tenuis]